MLRLISRVQIRIYTIVQIIISVKAKLKDVRRKHIVHPQVSVPTPLPVVKGQTTVSAPWESISLDNANDDKRPLGHITALTFHDDFVQKDIGSRWIIGIRDITFSNFVIVTGKCNIHLVRTFPNAAANIHLMLT